MEHRHGASRPTFVFTLGSRLVFDAEDGNGLVTPIHAFRSTTRYEKFNRKKTLYAATASLGIGDQVHWAPRLFFMHLGIPACECPILSVPGLCSSCLCRCSSSIASWSSRNYHAETFEPECDEK